MQHSQLPSAGCIRSCLLHPPLLVDLARSPQGFGPFSLSPAGAFAAAQQRRRVSSGAPHYSPETGGAMARAPNSPKSRSPRLPAHAGRPDLAGYLQKILTARVYDVAIETELVAARNLSRRLHNKVWLKREDNQPVFSFKLRGAYNKMAQLNAEQ